MKNIIQSITIFTVLILPLRSLLEMKIDSIRGEKVFWKFLLGYYAATILFPTRKIPNSRREKILIKISNYLLVLFYVMATLIFGTIYFMYE